MTGSHLGRELSIWADFNAFDDQNRIKASLRFADTPAWPIEGELVRLYDDEGNAVKGVIEEIHDVIVHVRPEMATWTSAEVSLHEPFASRRSFWAARPRTNRSKASG